MTETQNLSNADAGQTIEKKAAKPAPWLKLVLEIGPLVLFFFANSRPKLFEPLVSRVLPANLLAGENALLDTKTVACSRNFFT